MVVNLLKEMQFYTLVLCLLVHDILNTHATLPYLFAQSTIVCLYEGIFVNYITCSG